MGRRQLISRARFALLLLGALFVGHATAEPLVMSAPTESMKDAGRLYQPLAGYLSEAVGKKITFRAVDNYAKYSRAMRKGEFDLAFDGPQFAGWRLVNLDHTPLVRLKGAIRLAVAVRDEDGGPARLEDLAAANRVCAFPSPNVFALAFLDHFPNPARQPQLIPAGDFEAAVECLRNGEGEAAVIRAEVWDEVDQAGLRLIPLRERSLPERTLTAGPRVDAETAEKILTALLSEQGAEAASGLLKHFGRKGFVRARSREYRGLDELLDPVWGFQ